MNMVMTVIGEGLRSRPWHVFFDWAESRTSVDRVKLLVLIVIGFSMFIVLVRGMIMFANMAGFLYPAYMTLLTMARTYWASQSDHPSSDVITAVAKKETRKWQTYWVTYAMILIVENNFWFCMKFLPFYGFLKTLFLAWCLISIKNNGLAVVLDLSVIVLSYVKRRWWSQERQPFLIIPIVKLP